MFDPNLYSLNSSHISNYQPQYTHKMEERKNIIISLKSSLKESDESIEKRIQYLKIITTMNLVLTLLSAGILILSILSELFDYEIVKWQKTGLIAILGLSFVLNLPNQLYELKLLKHLKRIDFKSEFEGIHKLNGELKSIVDKLNNRLRNNWPIFILMIFILIMGLWQGLNNGNPYWKYMKLPIILFYGIIVLRFIFTNKKLTENIDKTEKHNSEEL